MIPSIPFVLAYLLATLGCGVFALGLVLAGNGR